MFFTKQEANCQIAAIIVPLVEGNVQAKNRVIDVFKEEETAPLTSLGENVGLASPNSGDQIKLDIY
jgi:hypothetical protein